MPIRRVPGEDLQYFLITYDHKGRERRDDPDGMNGSLAARVIEHVTAKPVTDVFFMSHGWKGDVPSAIDQYDRWTAAMLACQADRDRMRSMVPEFEPLLLGLHWPSLPWGEESQPVEGVSYGGRGEPTFEELKDQAAETIVDTPDARAALDVIFAAAAAANEPATLPAAVADAYHLLVREAGLEAKGAAGAPGSDAEAFDPERAFVLAQAEGDADAAFGLFGGIKGGILGVLRQLSFWKMKQRARVFGESGAASLLRDLQEAAAGSGREVRFHLMGHSFGCIVISGTIDAGRSTLALRKPVDAVYLVQGALSLWSYAGDIPDENAAGYFHGILDEGKVDGPLLVTRSEHDTAVGTLYPVAAGIAGHVAFDLNDLPKYGALGAYGAQGAGVTPVDVVMGSVDTPYTLEKGRVYNVDANGVINQGGGASGAHNDIDKPAVGHAFWAAIHSTVQ